MTTTSETGIKCEVLTIEGKMDNINKVTATSKDPHKKKIAEERCISPST
jgi:hypothetical protein